MQPNIHLQQVHGHGNGDQSDVDESSTDDDHDIKPDRPRVVKNWPLTPLKIGQVSGVSVNSDLQPVIFHRGDHVWNE